MTKALAFELSDDDRALLADALGDYAWRYRGEEKAERCEQLAAQFQTASDESAPVTERKPTTFSTVPPPMFI